MHSSIGLGPHIHRRTHVVAEASCRCQCSATTFAGLGASAPIRHFRMPSAWQWRQVFPWHSHAQRGNDQFHQRRFPRTFVPTNITSCMFLRREHIILFRWPYCLLKLMLNFVAMLSEPWLARTPPDSCQPWNFASSCSAVFSSTRDLCRKYAAKNTFMVLAMSALLGLGDKT